MAEIFEVILARNNEARLMFYHGGGALPCGSSVLSVTNGSGGWWNFKCRREGGNWFSISGSGWKVFARNRIKTMVSLSKYEDEDFYRIRVS